MILTDKQIWEICKIVGPSFKLDPYLVMAICEQECCHTFGKRGKRIFDKTKYDLSVARLEQNYYDRYTRDFEYSTATEVLLAASYGPMQMMGESLRECKNEQGLNFYEWWFSVQSKDDKILYIDAMTPFCVINAIDHYCDEPVLAITWGCRYFTENKLKPAKGDVKKALSFWNLKQGYPDEVLNRMPDIKKRFPLI